MYSDPFIEDESCIKLPEIFEAYYSCRRNKRNTRNSLAFEIDYESNLIDIYHDINTGIYLPGRSIAFIIEKPVLREIFAADFRDRIVHHLLINKLSHLFEKKFIYDSYSCRVGKGTHFGIKRISTFIRKCSANYTRDCYILKLDIEGFFMNINKKILYRSLAHFIHMNYAEADKTKVLELCRKIIFNDPTTNCKIRGKMELWSKLPKNKSLFCCKEDCGLPIGNLTSQVFANFYLDIFDHYLKNDQNISYYGRYVDDFIIVHESKSFLKDLKKKIKDYLLTHLELKIHPKKIYLQHYSKGVKFLGTLILPSRIYVGSRIKSNFFEKIQFFNQISLNHKPSKLEQTAFLSSMNSYLGIVKHYNTYNFRKKILFKRLNANWWNLVYLSGGITKFVITVKNLGRKEPRL